MQPEKIALITDSCADILPKLAQQYDIFVLPLKITYDEGSYSDGVDIQPSEIYARFPNEIPHTSLPDGETILTTFQKIADLGYTKAVAILFSSGLSGTYQLVKLLGEGFPALQIKAFDTLSGSLGTGAVVLRTAHYIREGRSWEEILSLVPRLIQNVSVFFSVDTLEYLQKGGRIGRISAVAGTLLNIKPIISFAPDGQLINIAKVRGRQHAMEELVDLAAAKILPQKRYCIMSAHGDAPEDGKQIQKMLSQRLPDYVDRFEGIIDCTLGVYVGPHLLGTGVLILDDDM